MNDLKKVEGYSALVKNTKTGAVLNVDTEQYRKYVAAKKTAKKIHQESQRVSGLEIEQKQIKDQINNVEEKITQMGDDIQQIKSLLMSLFDKQQRDTKGL